MHITQHNIYSFENVHLKIIVYILEDMATISLASIASSNQVLVELEANNKKILETFDSTGYTNNLHKWVAASYPVAYKIYQYTIMMPMEQKGSSYLCSDGQYREIWPYVDFCLGYGLSTTFLSTLQTKFDGLSLSYSLQTSSPSILIGIHATLPS